MLLTQGRELWVFVFWLLFLDITNMFHPLDSEMKIEEHYLYLNRITDENIICVSSGLYYGHLKEREERKR